MMNEYPGQTFAHARVVVRAELSARTKTEEKYISERLHKALEKRVNKITRENFLLAQGRYSEILYLIFSGVFLFFCFCSVRTPLYTICLYFPALF